MLLLRNLINGAFLRNLINGAFLLVFCCFVFIYIRIEYVSAFAAIGRPLFFFLLVLGHCVKFGHFGNVIPKNYTASVDFCALNFGQFWFLHIFPIASYTYFF